MSGRRDGIVAFLLAELAGPIGDIDDLDADLFELGLDSIDSVELTGAIEARFGIEVDPALTFEHRSVNALANYLIATLP
jgi:acyl carrier protein